MWSIIRLLVKEITVNHFDPEKDASTGSMGAPQTGSGQVKSPSAGVNQTEGVDASQTPDIGVFKARIRTKWYLVNMTLYASDLFAGLKGTEGDKFVFDTDWLRRQGSNL